MVYNKIGRKTQRKETTKYRPTLPHCLPPWRFTLAIRQGKAPFTRSIVETEGSVHYEKRTMQMERI